MRVFGSESGAWSGLACSVPCCWVARPAGARRSSRAVRNPSDPVSPLRRERCRRDRSHRQRQHSVPRPLTACVVGIPFTGSRGNTEWTIETWRTGTTSTPRTVSMRARRCGYAPRRRVAHPRRGPLRHPLTPPRRDRSRRYRSRRRRGRRRHPRPGPWHGVGRQGVTSRAPSNRRIRCARASRSPVATGAISSPRNAEKSSTAVVD